MSLPARLLSKLRILVKIFGIYLKTMWDQHLGAKKMPHKNYFANNNCSLPKKLLYLPQLVSLLDFITNS